MIVEERMRTYINSLDPGNTEFLENLEKDALSSGVPIIRREMQSFIKVLLAVKKPKRILEVGTAVGFSTLLMCEYGLPDLEITTIENYEKRIPVAKENFLRAGRNGQITLLEGDAGQILKELEGKYDLIFMDAAKGQYIHWLEDVIRLLAPEGILLSDNVLQEGELIESHYLVERRNRTIYKRMREYLYTLKHDKRLMTSILPLGDGAALSIKMPLDPMPMDKEEI
ncbi:O-methyltransferase [Blautia sp.]|uniref:O-methyltransferase n=1 Tax=Blautia sp. TaxID=1955243 RepID=UPI00280B104C|nr:O-methyltransferase [Blautia sp.]MED9881818.1 O-methyltransferase [Blautia sp.]